MPVQISFDRNTINKISQEKLNNKILPALSQRNIIVHLTDSFFQEILIDGNIARRSRHTHICNQMFNGNLVLSIKDALQSELNGNEDLFYNQTVETKIRSLFGSIAQGEQLTASLESLRQKLLKTKKAYDGDLKIRQEKNLKNVFVDIKNSIISRSDITQFNFDQYYENRSRDEKLIKIKKLLEANDINYDENISTCLDNQKYPRINVWLKSWYAYHFYTVNRWQPTLRKNDATDLSYIASAHCLSHFITNDKMLREIGTLCFDDPNKFITWEQFETQFLN